MADIFSLVSNETKIIMYSENVSKIPDGLPLIFWIYILLIFPFFVIIPNFRKKKQKSFNYRTQSFDLATGINTSVNT